MARAFKKGGGQRVLFACGQAACVAASRGAARQAKFHKLPARVANGGKIGHTYDGPVATAIKANWGWLLAGDERWPMAEPADDPAAQDAGTDGGASPAASTGK